MRPGIEFPPTLPEDCLAAAEEAVDFVFRYPSRPLAVTLSGSVALGQGDPLSDLDLWVVIEGDRRQRVQRRFDGLPCELFFNPAATIRSYFEIEARQGHASSMRLTLDGHVLYDPDGVARQLREEARAVLDAGPQVEQDTIVQRTYGAVDALDNAHDLHGRDPLLSSILTSCALRETLLLAHLLNGEWEPRQKDLRSGLAHVCPSVVEPLARYERDPTPESAGEVLQAVLGVSTFFEWESALERMQSESR